MDRGFGSPLARLALNERGNSIVEFGLAAPVIILLVIGAYDHGSAYLDSLRMTGAARAGAQEALYEPNDWQNDARLERAALEDYAGHALTDAEMAASDVSAVASTFCACADGTTVACTTLCAGDAPLRFVRMSLSRTHAVSLPYPWAPGGTFDLQQDAVVRVR